QAGLALPRLPLATPVFQGPLAIGLEVAVGAFLAQIEVQQLNRGAVLQGERDLGEVLGGQELHLVVEIDLRRPGRQGSQQGGQQQSGTSKHERLPALDGGTVKRIHRFDLNRRGKSGAAPSLRRRRRFR